MRRYILPKSERIFVRNFFVGLLVFVTLFSSLPINAFAQVAPVGGQVIFADGSTGLLKSRELLGRNDTVATSSTATSSLTAKVSTTFGAASVIRWAVLKSNPTRPERAAALLKADGSLNVLLYNASSTLHSTTTATNAWTGQWTVAGVGGTEQARTMQGVDMFYENKTGELIVTYGKNGTNGSFFYNIWDGNSWGGEQSQAVTDLAGPAHWIIAAGHNGSASSSNAGGIALIDDTNNRIYASHWNGTAWQNTVQLASTTSATSTARAAVAFENSSGKMMAVYNVRVSTTTSSTRPWWSNVLTPGVGWSATTSLPVSGLAAGGLGKWVQLASGPDDEIAMIGQLGGWTATSGVAVMDPFRWSGTASSSSWFKGISDTTAGDPSSPTGFVAWEQKTLPLNPTPQAVWQYSASLTDVTRTYVTATATLGAFRTAIVSADGVTAPDDIVNYAGDVVGDRIMVNNFDIDCDLFLKHWGGSVFQNSAFDHEITAAGGCANAVPSARPQFGRSYDFNYNKYNVWMRNWEWFDDAGASMAAENATSTLTDATTYHLRVNLHETGSTTQYAASKKLQYTTSITPDDSGTTWTDVGAQGSGAIWRYANGSGTELAELPDKQLASTTLNGVYLESAFASTTHATSSVQEYDFSIQSNGATPGQDYSFRLYDNEFDKPVLRKQDTKRGAKCGTDGLGSCWYPAATVAVAPAATATISGTLYGLNRISEDTTGGRLIRMRIGTSTPGFFSTTTIAGTGFWQIQNIETTDWFADMPIHTWIDTDSLFNAFTFTKASSTSQGITGLDLFRNRITLKHEGFSATSTSITDISVYDNDNDSDIKFLAVPALSLDVFKSQELHLAPGTVFEPNGTIQLHGNASTTNPDGDLYLATGVRQDGVATSSILNLGANPLYLAGNWFASSTARLISTDTVTFNSTSTQQKKIIATSTPFYNLQFDGTGGFWTFDAHSATTTNNFTLSDGAVTFPSTNLAIGGSFTQSSSLTHNSGTTTFNGTSGSQVFSGDMSGAAALNNVEFSGAATKVFGSDPVGVRNFYISSNSGAVTAPSIGLTVSGDFSNSGTFLHNSGTVTMTGTANRIISTSTVFSDLTINPSSTGTITLSGGGISVSGGLTVETDDTFSVSVGSTATSSISGSVTVLGTISGSGILGIQNSLLDAGGTVSTPVHFDVTGRTLTIPARTYGGLMQVYSAGNQGTSTLEAGDHFISGSLSVAANGSGGVLVNGASGNANVNITGDVDFTGTGAGSETIWSGTGLWTLSGNTDFRNGTYLASTTNSFVMNGASKTLYSSSTAFANLTLSGSVTLLDDISASGDAILSGALTAGNRTLQMSGAGVSLVGGNNTLHGLYLSGGSASLITSDLTIATSTIVLGAILDVDAGRNFTATSTMTLKGTLSGAGTSTFGSASFSCGNIPSGGTLSINVRADATGGNCDLAARSYTANVEAYSNSSGASRTISIPVSFGTVAGSLLLNAANTQNLTVTNSVSAAAVVVAGNVDFIGGGAGSETLDVSGGQFASGGYLDISGGIFSASTDQTYIGGNYTNTGGTFTHNSGTTTFDGASSQTISGTLTGSSAFSHLEFSGVGSKVFAANASTTNFFINAGSGAVTAPSGLLSIEGQYDNRGVFTHNSGKVYASGAVAQLFKGTATGTSAFNNFEIINSTATTTFGASASTTGTFTVITPNAKVAFFAGATTTLQNLTVTGTAGNEIRLWSATPGSRWNVHVPGTRSISYASVMDSDACNSSGNIDASGGTNIDKGNNVCWDFVVPTPSIDLVHYRWRADDGTETGASYLAPEDTLVTSNVFVGDKVRLRFAVQNAGTGAASDVTYRLDHASTSCSVWIPVLSSGGNSHFTMSESGFFLNLASTTHSAGITAPGGKSFTPGYMMSLGNQTNGHALSTSQYTEFEYSLISTLNVTAATTYCFRLTNAGSTSNFVYTIQPQIIVTPAPQRPQGGGGSGSAGGEENGSGSQQSGGGSGGGSGGEGSGSGGQQGGGGQGGGGGDSG